MTFCISEQEDAFNGFTTPKRCLWGISRLEVPHKMSRCTSLKRQTLKAEFRSKDSLTIAMGFTKIRCIRMIELDHRKARKIGFVFVLLSMSMLGYLATNDGQRV